MSCSQKGRGTEETVHFSNGRIKSIVEMQDAKKHGKYTEYYMNGQQKCGCLYQDDRLHGKCVFFDSLGSKNMEGAYEDGYKVGKWTIYRTNGLISQVIYYNKKGRAVYFEKFRPDGSKSTDPGDSKVLVLSESDSIDFGQRFEFLIVLGNKRPGTILNFYLDSIPTNPLVKGRELDKIDSVTAKGFITTVNPGLNSFLGFAVEIRNNETDSVLVFPFKYTFFVKSKIG